MKIAMVASEAKPFCKTGGLADVTYSLSKELAIAGEEVIIVMPLYEMIKHANCRLEKVDGFDVYMSWRRNAAIIYKTYADGITYYLIENDQYFGRNHIYGDNDDGERFAFFVMASRELLRRIGNIDIVHVHDWQSAMLPCLVKEDDYYRYEFRNTKFVLTIHNPAFQGMLDPEALGNLFNLPYSLYERGNCRHDGRISTLKTGIVYADKITTVSPNHHYELLSEWGGMHLDGVLQIRQDDFIGILNGIDYEEFNPETDPYIPYRFSINNFTSQKKLNKKALFERLHIVDNGLPLFSMVSRITWQKGFDILFDTIEELASKGCNIVVLGSGEYDYEQHLEYLRAKYPNVMAIYIGYNDELAHLIYASSDFFMMPSLFEPCGLGQMIAQRYGTLPIVRRTGGLKDSVINYDNNNRLTSNGFGFDNYANDDMRYTSLYALDASKDKNLIKRLKLNAMKTDNSWQKSAKQYLSLYHQIID